MKKLVLLFILFTANQQLFSQNIFGIINDYAFVTNINDNVFTVNTAAGFNIGDKVMIIKMKGATINSTNTVAYGDTINTNEAGKYVFSKVIAVSSNTITMSPYCKSFNDSSYIQIVRIPVYTNPIVVGTLQCQPYDGFTGGILAFEATGTITMNADIDVSASGYRGGDVWGSSFVCGSTNFYSAQGVFGPEGKKGEGIADYITGQECGKGKLANGGGGSYSANTGAGGGANYGKGGNGGWESNICNTNNIFSYGGQPLNHTNNRFFLGGGGGAPQADSANQVYNGGNGGGMIYIKANQIIGNGLSILSNGETTPIIQDEGASGGGSGGSIYLDVNSFTGPLTIAARGADGGSNFNIMFPTQCQGPGGGGGGGLINFSLPSTPVGVFTTVNGGSAGLILNPASLCYNSTHNAQDGGTGAVKYNFSSTPIPQGAPFSLGADVPFCQGANIILNAGAGYTSYLWDDFSTASTRSITGVGNYYVTVVNQAGCTGSDTVNVYLDTTLNADFSIVKKLGCEKDTIELVNNSTGASSYLWFFGDSQSSSLANPSHVYQNQAIYNVMLVAFNPPCSDTIIIPVDVTHPINAAIFITGSQAPIKQDSTCVLYDLNAQSISFPIGAYTHEFNWGDGTVDNTANNPYAKHLYSAGGNYFVTLTITDTIGCKDSVSKQVFIDGAAYAQFTISDSIVCVGTPILFIDTLSPFTVKFEYDFGDQSGLSDVHNPTHTFDSENNFIVTLTSHNLLCPDSSSSRNIVVDDYPIVNLGKDTSICPGLTGTIILTNLENPSGVFTWSTGEVANSINVIAPGHFWIKATSPNANCESVDSIWVKRDCYINVPNAFSPDGDGINDYFFPRELLSSNVKTFRMNIFNRWGENVFTTERIDGRGWDGKYNEKLQPMGVYIYVMDVEFNNKVKKSFKGNVTLVR